LGQGLYERGREGTRGSSAADRHFGRVASRALADNTGSLRVLEKTGFKRVGKAKGESGALRGKPIVLLELERPRWM
jgi:RimJ/RimL family protein N-acetyltransferase